MNESESGPPKGARPKAKPIPTVSNGVEASCSDNNNSSRSLYADDDAVNERLSSNTNDFTESPRPCGSGIEGPSRPGRSTDSSMSRSPRENGDVASCSSQASDTVSINSQAVQRPSNLALNGYSSSSEHSSVAEPVVGDDCLDSSELCVLPRQLLQDYCGLNGDCDLCGQRSMQLQACSLNRLGDDDAGASGGVREQDEKLQQAEEEGAVGGEEPAVEAGRCSPDSGEGEFENQNSRSPSCSWDQQSTSSAEECFYRYRGEDDGQRNPAVLENIPHRVNGENDARRRSSSPEMDYLEMDFDPSSSDWGGDDARPPGPVVPDLPLLEPAAPTPPPAPVPQQVIVASIQQEQHSPPAQLEQHLPQVAVTRSNILLWSQNFASELIHPFTTPLTSASNAIFYALTAVGHPVSRESVISHLTEAYPPQPVPQSVIGYLVHRASHTSPSTFSLILTGVDLARTIRVMSQGQLCARFFPIQSRQLLESGNLCSYIIAWLHRGVVPILTFSQVNSEATRHEMVFGSNDGGILTMGEPYRTLGETALSARLAGQGRVVVPHAEVVNRWSRDQDLRPLMNPPTLSWASQNILGSVVCMLRDATAPPASPSPSSPCTSRQPQPQPSLQLPIICESGVTLVCTTANPCYHLLETCTNFNH